MFPLPLIIRAEGGLTRVCASHGNLAVQRLRRRVFVSQELIGAGGLILQSLMGFGVSRIQVADGNWDSLCPGGLWEVGGVFALFCLVVSL